MSKVDFANYYTQKIPYNWQENHGGSHTNWWNYEKINKMLKIAGFKEIYRSFEQGSHFAEMRGKGRHYGFDSTHPELSLFVEAIKK